MDYACKISVIIPVSNMAKDLDQTIASWTAQTLKDIEIICVDDGSSDDSLHILEEKAQTDSRLHVCTLPANKGLWAARNYGIEKASGQYIMFADADAAVLPETCEELAVAMDEAQTDILQYPIEVLNAKGLAEEEVVRTEHWLTPYDGVLHGKDAFTICFRERKHSWNLAGKMFRTEICKAVLSDIDAAGIQDEHVRSAEDALLYFMLSYTAQSYKGIQGKKYYQADLCNGEYGHRVYTLTCFENLCMQSLVAGTMQTFLEQHAARDTYEDVIPGMRQFFLNNVVQAWLSRLAGADKAAGFDLMLRYWHSDEIIGKLAELHFYERGSLAKQIQGATSIEYDKPPVRTIAAYYHRLTNGGIERVLCKLCRLWQSMGYKVIVLTDKAPCKEDFELPEGTERIVIPDYQAITPQTYQKRASVLQRIIHDYHVDAVVYCAWLSHLLFWDELAIKTAGAACIVRCAGIFSCGMQWYNYDSFAESYSIADGVVTPCQTDHDFWKHYNANVHVTVNPLGDEMINWHPGPFRASHKILWLGRLDPYQKNPLDILPIMQEVIREVPDAVLTIVGKSENGNLELILKEKIAELHLERNIVYAGFHTDVRPWFLSTQIFLMTSSFEGFCNTLKESKIAGIPCVMYEMPYMILCEGNRGIIAVPQRDTKAAAQALVKLLQNDTLCAQYGRDARKHIEELANFDFKKNWREIFESVEHMHEFTVSNTDRLMVKILLSEHDTVRQKEKDIHRQEITQLKQQLDAHNREITQLKQELDSRNWEIHQLRHGSYIKRVARSVVPNRVKPCLKAILHRIPQGLKNPVKRLLRW